MRAIPETKKVNRTTVAAIVPPFHWVPPFVDELVDVAEEEDEDEFVDVADVGGELLDVVDADDGTEDVVVVDADVEVMEVTRLVLLAGPVVVEVSPLTSEKTDALIVVSASPAAMQIATRHARRVARILDEY